MKDKLTETLKACLKSAKSIEDLAEKLISEGVTLQPETEKCSCNVYIDYYKAFRKELDNMCVPLVINELKRIEPIMTDGLIVGMVGGYTDYIDCVYVVPGYRRQGLAKAAVLKFVEGKLNNGIRLHIINNNTVAKKFWNSIFELEEIGRNYVDTLYEIIKIKE